MATKILKLFLTTVSLVIVLVFSASSGFGQTPPDFTTAIETVAEKVGPAVVSIKTQATERYHVRRQYFGSPFEDDAFNRFFAEFFGDYPDYEQKRMGLGSGVIIDKEGYILTNEHVVAGADKILVTLPDGRNFPATLKGTDPRTDLAVIKIDAENLPVAQLGDSETIKIGQWVVAIGNPFGQILSDPQPTVTTGVVSALHRSLPKTSRRDTDYSDLIQTDAAINPGNSGGPLVNLQGEVVGINVAIFSTSGGYQGIGFAIPSHYVKRIVNQLIKGEEIEYGYIGVAIQDMNPRLAQYFGINSTEGVVAVQVLEDSPAHDAGLKEGDVIIKVNGIPVKNGTMFVKYINNLNAGEKADLRVLRDKKELSIPVTIAKRPKLDRYGRIITDNAKSSTRPDDDTPVVMKNEWRGMIVENVTQDIAQRLNRDNPNGVFITKIDPSSPAAMAGLREGDVIIEINRQAVNNIGDFSRAVAKAKDGQALVRTIRGYFVLGE
ncbi:MAG: Do family serine endopeptidase [Candidatus Omnitrophota bacterium]|nr:Do family serine endopeptidase [Candidatus Omnitrophota bacterium]MDZ4242532.1 Do family serine endopeptidase [Candidatus Omnitrophota bacterium]